MEVFLNKATIEVPENINLKEFIRTQNISTESIAVAINMKVIKRDLWEQTILKQGDKIVIICATKGG